MTGSVLAIALIAALAGLSACAAIAVYFLYRGAAAPLRSTLDPPSTIIPDADRGYAMRPELNVTMPFGSGQSYRIATDSSGLRIGSGPQPVVQRVATPSILFVGDSQTFGVGIANEHTFAARIGALLGVRALNAGVSGYGTVSMLRTIHRIAPGIRPAAIVVGHYADHLVRATNRCYPGFLFRCLQVPHAQTDHEGRVRIVEADPAHNAVAIGEFANYNRYIAGHSGFGRASDAYWRMRYDFASSGLAAHIMFRRRLPSAPEERQVARALYGQMRDAAAAAAARLVVVYIPGYLSRPLVGMPRYLQEVCDELGITLIDLTHTFRELSGTKLAAYLVPNDGHLNEDGHALVADRLLPVLREIVQQSAASTRGTRESSGGS